MPQVFKLPLGDDDAAGHGGNLPVVVDQRGSGDQPADYAHDEPGRFHSRRHDGNVSRKLLEVKEEIQTANSLRGKLGNESRPWSFSLKPQVDEVSWVAGWLEALVSLLQLFLVDLTSVAITGGLYTAQGHKLLEAAPCSSPPPPAQY